MLLHELNTLLALLQQKLLMFYKNATNFFSNERPLYAVFVFKCTRFSTPAQMYPRISIIVDG